MSTLTVTVRQRTAKDTTGYEGSFQLPGTTVTKLARKDGTTIFPNRGSLNQAARRVAESLSRQVDYVEPVKKAAKRSTTKKAPAKNTPAS